jgi:hypothetical protein
MSNEIANSTAERNRSTWRPEKGVIVEPQRLGYRPWEPTPGKPYSSEITESQADVVVQAETMLNEELRPPFVSDELASFVDLVYWSREANRATENIDSYAASERLLDVVALNPILEAKLKKADLGKANSEEVVDLIDELELDSAELARITHFYGYRLEHQAPMRQEIETTIKNKGGEVYADPETSYDIVVFDTSVTLSDRLSMAIAMKRKKTIGHIGDIVIYERTTFIVRIDKDSKIDQRLARNIRSLPARDPLALKKVIMQDGSLVQEVSRLLALDDLESVIPISTTVYACNAINRERHEAEHKERQQAISRAAQENMPFCRREIIWRNMGDIASGKNPEGMMTVGVSQEVIDALNNQ